LADVQRRSKRTIECIESEKDVPVVELLYGFEFAGDRLEQVVQEIRDTRAALLEESAATREMIRQLQEQFLKDLDRVQNQPDFQVPMVFTLCPAGWRGAMPALAEEWWQTFRGKGQEFELQLYCQHPGEMHPSGQPYLFRRGAEWLVAVRHWLQKLLPLLKTVSPVAGLTGRLEVKAAAQTALAVTETLAEEGPEEGALERLDIERLPERGEGAALDRLVGEGRARSRSELVESASRRDVAAARRAQVDAEFRHMAKAPDSQEEARLILAGGSSPR
jgi:hypothetical protein